MVRARMLPGVTAAVLLALAGCSRAAAPSPAAAPPPPLPAATSVPPAPVSAASAPASADPPAPSPEAAGTGSTGGTARPSLSGPTTPSVGRFPKPAQAEQGGEYWAVILAASPDATDPQLQQAVGRLAEAGYPTPGVSELDCVQGAREALGLPTGEVYYGVDVLFAERADADRFTSALGAPVEGVAQVTAYCLD